MKVCQLVRLLSKNSKGEFIRDLKLVKVERNRAVVNEQQVLLKEDSYKESGLLYVVDEEATREFYASKEVKKTRKPRKETNKNEE